MVVEAMTMAKTTF